MARTKDHWKSESLNTLDVLLDHQNPRIDIPTGASQDEIRRLLLDTEDVLDLAQEMVETAGLLAGERIIVVEVGGKFTVVEGNRRVAASQLLIKPDLIPKQWRKKFPAATDDLKAKLASIQADIAPNRAAAEITITKRHTEPGVKKWSPLAKQRRISRLIAEGKEVAQIAEDFAMSESAVRKTLKEFSLLDYAFKLKSWNSSEKKDLSSPQLKTNAFTRFFTLSGAKERIGLQFGPKGELLSPLSKKTLDRVFELLSRELLLERPGPTGKAKTRLTAEEVYSTIFKQDPSLALQIDKELKVGAAAQSVTQSVQTATLTAAGGTPATSTAKPQQSTGKTHYKKVLFFEDFKCPVEDVSIRALAPEIASIDYKRFPTAATFLYRALVERTLDWAIAERKLTRTLRKEWADENAGSKHKGRMEPGLEWVIKFCIRHAAEIFADKGPERNLNHLLEQKTFCDLVIHGKWMRADAKTLEAVAAQSRSFIEQVLSGRALSQ